MFSPEAKAAITAIAEKYGFEPAALLAVCEVESGGRIHARVKGRNEPLIRFEGHYFYRLLPAARRNLAVTRGLAHRLAGRIKNPLRQASRWKLLERATVIDSEAALQSTSWGIGQVMGIHWQWLEYASPDAMVKSARSGIEGQAELMVRYILKAGLAPHLREHDWAGFARAYNGLAYARNRYDTKMAAAHARHGGTAVPRPAMRHQPLLIRLGARGQLVHDLQHRLVQIGHPLQIDGDFGPATQAALMAFQSANSLIADGIAGPLTLEALQRHSPQPANLLAC